MNISLRKHPRSVENLNHLQLYMRPFGRSLPGVMIYRMFEDDADPISTPEVIQGRFVRHDDGLAFKALAPDAHGLVESTRIIDEQTFSTEATVVAVMSRRHLEAPTA